MAQITEWNATPKFEVGKVVVKFIVQFMVDKSMWLHCLWGQTYNTKADADDVQNHTGLMLTDPLSAGEGSGVYLV